MSPTARRLLASLGAIVAAEMCIFVAVLTVFVVKGYEWASCSTTYDLWNGVILLLRGLSALGFGAVSLLCLVHLVTLEEQHTIKPVVVAASCLLILALAVGGINPTPDSQVFTRGGDCYSSPFF
ncbi:MAG: hypothetical protein M3395_09865 [Chloroflexota bacterium]|nr:hypothetical protein [Chloroflexota bacterium]